MVGFSEKKSDPIPMAKSLLVFFSLPLPREVSTQVATTIPHWLCDCILTVIFLILMYVTYPEFEFLLSFCWFNRADVY